MSHLLDLIDVGAFFRNSSKTNLSLFNNSSKVIYGKMTISLDNHISFFFQIPTSHNLVDRTVLLL